MAILISLLVLMSLAALGVRGEASARTRAGEVLGLELEANGSAYRLFAGIPYAEPPVRFAAPVAKAPWAANGARSATEFGPACPQDTAGLAAFAPYWPLAGAPASAPEISEDCLTLNVYTAVAGNRTGARAAVMVWLHGGSYRNGLGSVYDASQLALKGGVVVVTLNYRLGPLGFLYAGDEGAPGNVGLMDQQLALRWVQDNIQAFGGDPARVTIFGQSDVHGSPTVHVFARASRSLFHRVAAHSGVMQAEDLMDPSQATEDAKLLAYSANCPGSSESTGALVRCLRDKPLQDLLDSYEFFSQRRGTSFSWRPVLTRDFFEVPGDSLPYDLLSVFNSGDGSVAAELLRDLYPDFSVANGATEEQLARWLDVNLDQPDFIDMAVKRQYIETDTTNASVARMAGLFDIQLDRAFYRYGVRALRELRSLLPPSRLLIFGHRTSSETRFPDPYGLVPHGAELPYVFGWPHDEARGFGARFTDEERVLSLCMIRHWSNFAKTGDPNSGASSACSPTWPEYGESEGYLLAELSAQTVGERYRSDGVQFWGEYLAELEAAAEGACTAAPVPAPEECGDRVIGEGLGLVLTQRQTETLIESLVFVAVALLCLCAVLLGAACGYRYRRRALSHSHYQSMATEDGVVPGAADTGEVPNRLQRHPESPGTSGSSSPYPVGDQAAPLPQKYPLEDDQPEYRAPGPTNVTFSEVHNSSPREEEEEAVIDNEEEDVDEMFPPPPDGLDEDNDIDQEVDLPLPPEENGGDNFPPPPPADELEELNLSDEFRIPDEIPSSSPATTVSAGAGPDDGGSDDSGDRDEHREPPIDGGGQASPPADIPVMV